MPLPAPAWLSLSDTVRFVVEATGESEDRVHEVLTGAGLMGAITATGCRHLSTYKDSAMYFAHPALDERETLPPETWSTTISWLESRIGRYDLVRLNRADTERWLAAAHRNEHPRAEDSSPRPKKGKKETKVEAVAKFLRGRYGARPSMSNDELTRAVEKEAQHIGGFKSRTLQRAIAEAWPKQSQSPPNPAKCRHGGV